MARRLAAACETLISATTIVPQEAHQNTCSLKKKNSATRKKQGRTSVLAPRNSQREIPRFGEPGRQLPHPICQQIPYTKLVRRGMHSIQRPGFISFFLSDLYSQIIAITTTAALHLLQSGLSLTSKKDIQDSRDPGLLIIRVVHCPESSATPTLFESAMEYPIEGG